jgi:hypothetical protein
MSPPGAAGGAVVTVPGLSTGAGLAPWPEETVALLELTAVFAHAEARGRSSWR